MLLAQKYGGLDVNDGLRFYLELFYRVRVQISSDSLGLMWL